MSIELVNKNRHGYRHSDGNDPITEFKYDVHVKKDKPGVRLNGLETDAIDVTIRENSGRIEAYNNSSEASIGFINPQKPGLIISVPVCKQISEVSFTANSTIDKCYAWLSKKPNGMKPQIGIVCDVYNNGGYNTEIVASIGSSSASLSTSSTTYQSLSAVVDADDVDGWLTVNISVSGGTAYVKNLTATILWCTE